MPNSARTYTGAPASRCRRAGALLVVPLFALTACAGAASGGGEPPAEPSPAADGHRAVQPGAPGQATRALTGEERTAIPRLGYTDADVRFMQNMIHHHAQALVLASLVPERASRADLHLLADRIDRSQMDEIALMERWLEVRGEEVPEWRHPEGHGADAAHAHREHAPAPAHGTRADDDLMAGMLSPEQLAELAAAEGEEFDRLFLEFMIYHHDGALQMVDELFSMPGAAQDSEIFQFASHVGSDQRIEIARMERMLRNGA